MERNKGFLPAVYKKAYPVKPRAERLERQKRDGRPVCPACGAEALKTDGREFYCLRCGFHGTAPGKGPR